jgi:hypothetical protein
MMSLKDGLSSEEERIERIVDCLDDSSPRVPSYSQYIIEIMIALVLVGLLLLLCKTTGQTWLANFYTVMLKAQKPM